MPAWGRTHGSIPGEARPASPGAALGSKGSGILSRSPGTWYRQVKEQALASARAGFAASTLRWFCGADGNVVVEQDARWSDPATEAEPGRARVTSRFVIGGETVAAYQRHDTLDAALTAAGLTAADEVTG
jgi:hypothetical protein